MSPGKIAIAATTFACMTLVSFGWSEQRGVSLSVASASAQTNHSHASRHQASRHMAVASSHRHGRRVVRGYGPNPVAAGANLAAGAVNTAGAVAAGAIGTAGAIAAAPFSGTYAAAPGWGGYYAPGTWGDYDCSPGYGDCRPYAEKNWAKTPLK